MRRTNSPLTPPSPSAPSPVIQKLSQPPVNPAAERLVVMIPCLNEEKNVQAAVDAVMAEADKLPMKVVALIIDDGSTDRTREIVEGMCATNDRCQAIFHEKNQGVGASFLEGVNWAKDSDWVTVHPGDNEFDFWSIHRFIQYRYDYDLILGYPQNTIVRTLPRRLASDAFHLMVRLAYGYTYNYLNGFWLFRAQHFRGIPVSSKGHAFCPELIAKAQLRYPALRIGEAPYISRGRKMGGSKAFQPRSVVKAMREFWVGLREVSTYRTDMVSTGTPAGAAEISGDHDASE